MNQKPEKPEESDCCGSGCNPCIFDVYEERLKKWQENKESNIESLIALNPSKYLPFLIKSIEAVNADTNVYTFQSVQMKEYEKKSVIMKDAKLSVDYDILSRPLQLNVGNYLILKGREASNSKNCREDSDGISRPYTPLLDKTDFEKGIFKTLITLYQSGRMSNFVRQLEVNDIVFWRGPYQEFEYPTYKYQNFLLIGGGTGVVPLYNIAKNIIDDEKEIWIKVINSFKTVDSMLLRKEINNLKQFWNFKVDTYISNQSNISYVLNYGESITFKRIDESIISNALKKYKENEVYVVVCGPANFNTTMKNILGHYLSEKNIFLFK